MNYTICEKTLAEFKQDLLDKERSNNTIEKYLRDVRAFLVYIGENTLDKALLVEYKAFLQTKYVPASVNSMIAAINCFLEFIGKSFLRLKPLRIQRSLFSSGERELKKDEYERLLKAAKTSGNKRLMLIVETICSTGIRVSELRFITLEAVKSGRAEINCKGKHRTVFLTEKLCDILNSYIEEHGITGGAIFVTRNGKPLDRSNIWRDMKKLCESADVPQKKVFPHNLRHLFARTFYSTEKDLLRLADILGHSSINTTRIYTMESGCEHVKLLEKMNLVIVTT